MDGFFVMGKKIQETAKNYLSGAAPIGTITSLIEQTVVVKRSAGRFMCCPNSQSRTFSQV